ncbi:hypothetical protein [Mesonia aquimarina]|uniref:hypothetical protein n=1 Tax=Mesonia aquimarina TaxID=1504967 RepID=UPI000EF5C8F7|nr:hypothetical protein [Mesonia aquimarina]
MKLDDFARTIEFNANNDENLKEKLQHYFSTYNFQLAQESSTEFNFSKKRSLLKTAWTINPLNWNANIEVKLIEGKKIIVEYVVEGNGQITPVAYADLFETFLINLKRYIATKKDFKEENQQAISSAKKKMIPIIFFYLIGTFAGLFAGIILGEWVNFSLLSTIGLVIGFHGTSILINSYFNKKEKYISRFVN